MTIHLYAEHLVNIRALSIQAALSTLSNEQTRAILSAHGDTLTLEHEGEIATIKLPIQVPGGHNDATLTIPPAPAKDLSFRLSLQGKSDSGGLLANGTIDSENIVPWTSNVLTAETEIRCVHCESTVVQRQSVKLWKNLPSENWAEMMDFWHCHRPHVPHGHDHKAPTKGYGADSTLTIQSGVGLVDPVDFVLSPDDCMSLKVGFLNAFFMFILIFLRTQKELALSGRKVTAMGALGYGCPRSKRRSCEAESAQAVDLVELFRRRRVFSPSRLGAHGPDGINTRYIQPSGWIAPNTSAGTNSLFRQISSVTSSNTDEMLRCTRCDTIIGHVHTSGGLKLRKHNLSLSISPSHKHIPYASEKWFACLLLASIDTQGVRKFLVQSTGSDQAALKLWIFTPDINISSSSGIAVDPIRAVKVFWRDCMLSSQDAGALNRQTLMEGEIELPPHEMQLLRQKIIGGTLMLPQTARKFQDWTVALLPRFKNDEVEL